MSRAWLIRLSARLANSVSSTRPPRPNALGLIQVTHFSHLTQSPLVSLSRKPRIYENSSIANQLLFFSSKPESFINLVLSNDWSEEIENELEKSNPKLTHESIVYVLMKLSKDLRKAFDFFKWVRDRKGFEPSSVLYNLLLRISVGKNSMDQFWVVARELRGKGFCIDKRTNLAIHGTLKQEKLDQDKKAWTVFYDRMSQDDAKNHLAKDVIHVILGSDWTEELERMLKELKFPLSDNFLLMVLKELWPHPIKALQFFNWVSHCQGYEHNTITYNEMAKVLAQHETMGNFWELVKRMRSEGYEIDTDTYVKISRRLRNGDAVELFEFMMDGPYKPSIQDCILLLKNLSIDLNPDMNLVFRVVNKYKEAGNSLTKAIYDGIHRSSCKVGRLDEAHKIVEDMRNAGYKPDNLTFSQEIHGLCKLKRFEEALKVLELMEVEGCIPDIKTWTILIQGYCSAGLVDEALLCFGKMMDKNIDPDADLLQVFINGFLSENKLFGAQTFLIKMVQKGNLKPWQATYKLMIEKLLEAGKLKEALDLLGMMKKHKYPPYPEPFVQYISKSGTVEDAKEFLDALPLKGSPSNSAYVHVITSFFHEGRHSEAKDLLYKSPRGVRIRKEICNLFGSAESSNNNNHHPVES